MLSWWSPSALLENASVSWSGALHTAGALGFTPGTPVFAAAIQGTPLKSLDQVAAGLAFRGPVRL